MLRPLGGCGTISTYSGPEPAEGEIAILDGYHHFYLLFGSFVDITGVDGKRPEGLFGRVPHLRRLGHEALDSHDLRPGGKRFLCAEKRP